MHLENEQTYFFTPENATRVTREAPRTTLTQFFVLNQTDEFARIFYHQVPTFYAWQTNKTWKRRLLGNEVPNNTFLIYIFQGINDSINYIIFYIFRRIALDWIKNSIPQYYYTSLR